MYNPVPKFRQRVQPKVQPKAVVPSYIGEPGLVGNWLFYNGAGDVLHDFSGYENHGDIIGPKWVDGSFGWGLDFDGVDDRVKLPTFPTFSEFTVIAWSKHRSVSDGDMNNIFNLRQNNGVILRDEGDGNMYAYIYDGTWTSFSESISNDTWNMWTARYDGSVFEGSKRAAFLLLLLDRYISGKGDGQPRNWCCRAASRERVLGRGSGLLLALRRGEAQQLHRSGISEDERNLWRLTGALYLRGIINRKRK